MMLLLLLLLHPPTPLPPPSPPGKTNLCGRTDDTQGSGVLLDGTTRFSCVKDGKTVRILMFMGCSTFSEYGTTEQLKTKA